MSKERYREQIVKLMWNDVHEYFHTTRALMAMPLLGAGIVATAWLHSVAPFYTAAVLVAFAAMETQFNNIVYRTPSELEAIALYPVPWEQVILAKNIATLVLTGFLMVPVTIVTAYFSPGMVGGADVAELVVYAPGVMFVLLQIGNTQSILNPRRESGWRYEDLTEVVWMLAMVGIASVPALIFGNGLILIAYAIIAGSVWWFRSIPRTAKVIEERYVKIIEQG